MRFRDGALFGALLLTACADFGGPISGNAPLSPQEQRLQAIEAKLGEVTRKVDNLNFASQTQDLQRLTDDMRALRGDVEKLRYDVDTGNQRSRELYQDLDKRI